MKSVEGMPIMEARHLSSKPKRGLLASTLQTSLCCSAMGNALKSGFPGNALKLGSRKPTPGSKPQPRAAAGDAEHGAADAARPLQGSRSLRRAPELSAQEREDLRLRSKFLIVQNVLGVLLAATVLATAFVNNRSSPRDGRQCAPFMFIPIISVGGLLLFICFMGLVTAIVYPRHHQFIVLEWLQLLLLFCLVISLFVFAIFSLEVTNKGLAHSVTGYGQSYKEYRLFEYPHWMQHRVKVAHYWTKVRTCILHSNICQNDVIPEFSSNLTSISIDDLSPIEKGCCIPPSACNISFVGSQRDAERIHEKARNGVLNSSADGSLRAEVLNSVIHAYTRDCSRWNSNPYQLCYDCDTCKAGVIQANMDTWKKEGILYVVLVMILVMVTVLFACSGYLV